MRNSILMMAAMMGMAGSGMMGMGMGTRGMHRGENPLPKSLDNSPQRAKGLQPFEIDGVVYYAGTLKGAQKMAKRFRGAGLLS